MSLMDNYPVGMSVCDHNGIMGNCGRTCPGYLCGDCEYFHEIEPGQLTLPCVRELDEILGKTP